MIVISRHPFSSTSYYSGAHYGEKGEGYEFTLCVSENEELGHDPITEITWIDNEPENIEEVEKLILERFNALI